MQQSHYCTTSDRFGRYYTDSAIATLLIEAMGLDSPRITIDLGAGSGALTREAGRRWKRTRFVTVDIDQSAASCQLRALPGAEFTHHTADALDRSIDEKIGLNFRAVDSALCNPPYVRPEWQKHFGEILEDAGMSHIIPKTKCTHADVLFIAQNLRFLGTGGKLGLILPDGIIAGEKYGKLRKFLATSHKLERVIELPRRVFQNTDAKAHIVVLSKHLQSGDYIEVQRLEANGVLSQPIRLSQDQPPLRMDYSYLASLSKFDDCLNRRTLRDITQLITRGSHSSSARKNLPFPVFHTTDFPSGTAWLPSQFKLENAASTPSTGVLAKKGDILLARVGRNLDSKVCFVEEGQVSVSDCIFVLRVAPEHRTTVLGYLTSANGKSALRAASHGVGASFITTDSLLRLEI